MTDTFPPLLLTTPYPSSLQPAPIIPFPQEAAEARRKKEEDEEQKKKDIEAIESM